MHISLPSFPILWSKLISNDILVSILLGAIVSFLIAYLIYKLQKKESLDQKHDHDIKLEEIKHLHLQDSEKIKVLYDLILKSQAGSIGGIESAVLEQKIEVAASTISNTDSEHAQALKAIAEKDKEKADTLIDKISQQEHELEETYKLHAMNESRYGNYLEATKWYEKIMKLDPDNFEALKSYISDLIQAGFTKEARETAFTALDSLKGEGREKDERTLQLYNSISTAYSRESNWTESEKYYPDLEKLYRKLYDENSSEMGNFYSNLACGECETQIYDESEKHFLKALELLDTGREEDELQIGKTLSNLSNLYSLTCNYEKGIDTAKKALNLYAKYLDNNHPEILQPLNDLAVIYLNTNRLDEAEEVLLRQLDIIQQKLGEQHPWFETVQSNLAALLLGKHNFVEAEAIIRRQLERKIAKDGENSVYVAIQLLNIYVCLYWQNQMDEGEKVLLKTISILEKAAKPEHPVAIQAQKNLGDLYYRQRKLDDAMPIYKKLIEIYYSLNMENTIKMAEIKTNLAVIHVDLEQYEQAKPFLHDSLKIYEEQRPGIYNHYLCLQNLTMVYENLGEQQEAAEYARQADEIKTVLDSKPAN